MNNLYISSEFSHLNVIREPYSQAKYNFQKYEKIQAACKDKLPAVSFVQKTKHLFAAIGLSLPFVNVVVMVALKHFGMKEQPSLNAT